MKNMQANQQNGQMMQANQMERQGSQLDNMSAQRSGSPGSGDAPSPKRQRLEGSFEGLLNRAHIRDFRFHDLRHTFASWYMMNGGDLYELAKLLGHANIKMTERYAKLGKAHISKTGDTAKLIWSLLEKKPVQHAGQPEKKTAHTA